MMAIIACFAAIIDVQHLLDFYTFYIPYRARLDGNTYWFPNIHGRADSEFLFFDEDQYPHAARSLFVSRLLDVQDSHRI